MQEYVKKKLKEKILEKQIWRRAKFKEFSLQLFQETNLSKKQMISSVTPQELQGICFPENSSNTTLIMFLKVKRYIKMSKAFKKIHEQNKVIEKT